MLLGWFKSRNEVHEFGRSLAQELARHYPPPNEGHTKSASPKRLAVTIEDVYARALKFKREKRLGVYQKAKLGNAFRWKLKELGYNEDFVEQVTKALVIRLAQK